MPDTVICKSKQVCLVFLILVLMGRGDVEVSGGQNTHICYAEGIVYVCSAAIVLGGTEGK